MIGFVNSHKVIQTLILQKLKPAQIQTSITLVYPVNLEYFELLKGKL